LLASDPIDVEDVVRISVENKMCDERGALEDTFNVPQYLIYDKMNEVCVKHDNLANYWPVSLLVNWWLDFLCVNLLWPTEVCLVRYHCSGSNK